MWIQRKDKGWGPREEFTAWSILRSKYLHIRIHRIREPDRPLFYHTHPRHMLAIMLWGKYFEEREGQLPIWRKAGSLTGTIALRNRCDAHAAWHPHGEYSWSVAFFFGPKSDWFKVHIQQEQ